MRSTTGLDISGDEIKFSIGISTNSPSRPSMRPGFNLTSSGDKDSIVLYCIFGIIFIMIAEKTRRYFTATQSQPQDYILENCLNF